MSEQFEPHAEMPPEPVLSEAETRRLVEQIEARIKATEKLERAIATRPQPSAEPVAEQVWREAYRARHDTLFCHESKAAAAVIASALEAARREALEEAAKAARDMAMILPVEECCVLHGDLIADAIEALQENPNG